MIKYSANYSAVSIKEIEVTRETESSVYVKDGKSERLERKKTNYEEICNSYLEAKDALVKHYELAVERKVTLLKYESDKLEKAKLL